MPDRVIRDELAESDRWLDLPTDAARLAFIGFLWLADDFGNFEGGPRRLYRYLHKFTQIKTPDAAVAAIDALMLCDLIRRYEVEGRELFHIPRFRPHRQYLVRKMPASPWDSERIVGKKRRVIKRGLALNQQPGGKIATTSQPYDCDVAEGVGVGGTTGTRMNVHRGSLTVVPSKKRTRAQAPFVLPDWVPETQWLAWIESRTKARKPPTAFAQSLAVSKLAELQKQGHHPAAVLAQSAFNGWTGLFPIKEQAR